MSFYEDIPKEQKLVRHANPFACELCEVIIGHQPDNPDSITDYYRIKLENPLTFVFCCPNCASRHRFQSIESTI